MAATAEKQESRTYVKFGIEIDNQNNGNQLIQSVPGLRLRSAIDGHRPVKDVKSGEMMVPVDRSRGLATLQRIPGMELHVDPENRTIMIKDPLNNDEQMCKRIYRYMKETSAFSVGDKIEGVPPRTEILDPHRMKTLCREMLWLLESGDAKLVRGKQPTIEEIEELPGKFLLNPGSRIGNTQPVYEDQWDEWVENLSRSGG